MTTNKTLTLSLRLWIRILLLLFSSSTVFFVYRVSWVHFFRISQMSQTICPVFYQCLKDFVVNSLNAKATAIAIRFNKNDYCLQIIDNGTGITFNDLQTIDFKAKRIEGLFLLQNSQFFQQSVEKFREIAFSLLVISRCENDETYGKMFTKSFVSKVKKIPQRSTHGTTIVLKFLPKIFSKSIFTISYLKSIIAIFALNNPQVSFSFRDDETMKTIGIKKDNAPMDTLETICSQKIDSDKIQYIQNEIIEKRAITAYFGYDCSKGKIRRIFLNNEQIHWLVLKKIVIEGYLNTVNSCGRKQDVKFNLKREKVTFLLYINSQNDSFQNLIEDVEFLNGLELRIFEAVSIQLQTLSLKNLKHIYPLEIQPPKVKKSKVDGKIKLSENERKKKKIIPNLEQISLPLLNFTCRQFRSHVLKGENSESLNNSVKRDISESEDCKGDDTDHSQLKNISNIYDDCKLNSITENCVKNIDNGLQKKEELNGEKLFDVKNIKTCLDHLSFGVEDLGEWSDWIYDDSISNQCNAQEYYKFLPQKIRALLPINQNKLIKKPFFNKSNKMGIFKWNKTEHKIEQANLPRRQDFHVRPCKNSQKRLEITLEKNILTNLKVLSQVNKEFIAGVSRHEDKKIIILIDQHAMDERIRYETLLREYKCNENALSLVYLYRPIEISELPQEIIPLILNNVDVLRRFGITLRQKDANTFLISTAPSCFFTRKCFTLVNVANNLRDLIVEIGEKLINKSGTKCLPVVIHNAIASEACHGAIRFGDILSVDECKILVSHWIETDLPNRCAHGRPAVVPLMELNANPRKRQLEKLNFKSLRR